MKVTYQLSHNERPFGDIDITVEVEDEHMEALAYKINEVLTKILTHKSNDTGVVWDRLDIVEAALDSFNSKLKES